MEQFVFQGLTICSILQDKSIVGNRQMHNRRFNGFILKLRGSTEYRDGSSSYLLEAGQILVVPKGSSYFIREVEPGYSYVVNFACSEDISFSTARLPLPTGMDITQAAEKMYYNYQKGNLYGALSDLYRILEKSAAADQYVSPREKQLLEPVLSYLQEHLTDPELDLSGLCDLSGVSNVYLRRIFKKQQGVSPAGFVIRQRLQMAQQLLLSEEKLSVAEVSAQVGYRDPLYFSRLFKKQLGMSPTEYCDFHRHDLF